jgi:hypothetical protein
VGLVGNWAVVVSPARADTNINMLGEQIYGVTSKYVDTTTRMR